VGLSRAGRAIVNGIRGTRFVALLRNTAEKSMWYFTWILGIGVALSFGIINVMWIESKAGFDSDK